MVLAVCGPVLWESSALEKVVDAVLEVTKVIAHEEVWNILTEEFGEEVADELVETAVGVLLPGLGLAVVAWKAIKYGGKIKRIFWDEEPLNRVREHIAEGVRVQTEETLTQLTEETDRAREAIRTELQQGINRWETEALQALA